MRRPARSALGAAAWTGSIVCFATAAGAVTRFVSPTGSDGVDCTSQLSPCQSLQRAVNQAGTGDTLAVAEGTYTYTAAQEVCAGAIGETAVVCIVNKVLTLQGGYPTGSWVTPDPTHHPSVISGQSTHRGLLVEQTGDTQPAAGLTLDGFEVRNCSGGPATAGDLISAFGGGLSALGPTVAASIPVTLHQVLFDTNLVQGGSAGTGAGGGVALRNVNPGTLDRVTFHANTARGGVGSPRGGFGIGGGVFTFQSVVTGTNLTFTANRAEGGATSGDGLGVDGERADAQGGGLAAHTGSTVSLTGIVATGNVAVGGNASLHPGGAFGGALYAELASLTASVAELSTNTVTGGAAVGGGATGGLGAGGAVMSYRATLDLERARLVANQSQGGAGTSTAGAAGGGGVYVSGALPVDSTAQLTNVILGDNTVSAGNTGGGGGALFLQNSTDTLTHVTMARNQLLTASTVGQAIALVGGSVAATLNHCIVANHSGAAAALYAQAGSGFTFNRGLFAGNSTNTGGPGGFSGLATVTSAGSAGFRSAGAPNYDYHLVASSVAVDLAVGSALAVDIDGQARTGTRDTGADELDSTILIDGFESGSVAAWSLSMP